MKALFVEFHPQMQKRGRPRKFKPVELLEEFQNYIQDRMTHPIIEAESENNRNDTHRGTKLKEKEHPQMLSVADFCVYLGCSRNWWNELPDEFLGVKSHISTYIDNFQLKGAAVGVFNANIVSRLLGLKDKTEFSGGGIILRIETDQETKDMIEGGLG